METKRKNQDQAVAHLRTMEEIDNMPGEEIVEKRTAMAKVYSLGQDLYQAVLFSQPIHYRDPESGAWHEIDNDLIALEDGDDFHLENKHNGQMKVQMRGISEDWMVRLEDENGNTLAWRIEGMRQTNKTRQAVSWQRDIRPQREAPPLARKAAAQMTRAERASQKTTGAAIYEGAWPDTDIRCAVDGNTFKEDVIFKTREAVQPIAFILEAPGLTLCQAKGGLEASDAQGRESFFLPAPFLVDASGNTGPVAVSLEPQGDQWRMVYTPDMAWSETAALPITLDPVVVTKKTSAERHMNAVHSAYPDRVYANVNSFYATHIPSINERRLGFIKFDAAHLPAIDASCTITNATLRTQAMTRTSSPLYIQEVLTDYSPATLTYNTMPQLSDYDLDSCRVPRTYDESINFIDTPFNITRLIQKWYAGDNKGVAISTRSPNTAEQSISVMDVYLAITYVSKAGLQGHMKYESFSAGRAGTVSVNLFNGNVVLSHADTASGGSRLPVSVSHYYNTCYHDVGIYNAGKGWKHSLCETMHMEKMMLDGVISPTPTTVYVHTRADGNRTYYKKMGVTYTDLSGTFMKLEVKGIRENNVTLKTAQLIDKGDTLYDFNEPLEVSTGRDSKYTLLRKVTDALKNTVVIASENPQKITSATDGAGRNTTLSYNAEDLLASIKGPGDVQGVSFGYDAQGYLTSITHEDGEMTRYTYNSQGLLSAVTNYDGYSVEIEYTQTQPYRAIRVTERNGDTLGNSRSYTYDAGMTTVKDMTVPDGKSVQYHFNGNGNIIAANDQLGQASVTRYLPEYPINHPESISRMQRTIINQLRNHRFEQDDAWETTGGVYTTGEAYLGSRCMLIAHNEDAQESNVRQSVSLLPGSSYTFSCFLKRAGDADVWMAHEYIDHTGATVRERSNSMKTDTADASAYHRVAYSFTLPQDAAAGVTVYVISKGTAGTASTLYIDAAQLEEGPVANRYNLLDNGDFAFSDGGTPLYWTAQTDNKPEDKVRTDIGQGKPVGLSQNTLRLHGGDAKKTGIYQDIDITGKRGDIFVLGGWAKALTAQHRDKKKNFSVRIGFRQMSWNSVYTDAEEVKWSDEWTDWQFACGPVRAGGDYLALRVYISYEDNINWADFAGMFLHREEYGWSYVYDGKGNVLSVQDLSGQKRNATYDAYNNLVRYQHWGQPAGYSTTLNYGTTEEEMKKHLLLSVTSPMYKKTEYTYDSSGNMTQAQQCKNNTLSNGFIITKTSYTADMNHPATKTDARGKQVEMEVDAQRDTLTSVTGPTGQQVAYTYDALRRLQTAQTQSDGKTYKNTYSYQDDNIAQVRHNTSDDVADDVVYDFAYDPLGNPTTVSVGDQMLSQNVYTDTGDKLRTRIEYGNGGQLRYTYDPFKRLTGIAHDDDIAPRYHYAYDAGGNVAEVRDDALGRVKTCEFDMSGRPMRVKEKQGVELLSSSEVSYDEGNRVAKQKEQHGNTPSFETSFTYDRDNMVSTLAYGRDGEAYASLALVYDHLGRTTSRALSADGNTYTQTLGYLAGDHGNHSSTGMVETITQPGQNLTYTYDDAGRILSEQRNTRTTTYSYDGLGQLIRVNDPLQSRTTTFAYDAGGNILDKRIYAYITDATLGSPLEVIPYSYGDAAWRDKLTAYNGTPITYDAIGNPLQDGTWTYTWRAGIKLAKLEKPGETLTFDYDANGNRVRKHSTSTGTTEYTMLGTRLVHQSRRSVDMHFWYNDLGKPQVAWYNCGTYCYVYNLQGDVIALVDTRTNEEVVAYAYDAWGKQISCTGAMADTLGVENPFRYRGYVYDEETGWYCLPARYYRPDIGRFVNADTVVGTAGKLFSHSIFTYCINSPVTMEDPSGHAPAIPRGITLGIPALDFAIAVLSVLWAGIEVLSLANNINALVGNSSVLREPTDEMKTGLRTEMDKVQKVVEEKREYEPDRNPNGRAEHHIVAKRHGGASKARMALNYAGISVEDPINKVKLTERFHQNLQGGYYAAVEAIFSPVSEENGYSPLDARFYCDTALQIIRGILLATDKILYLGN